MIEVYYWTLLPKVNGRYTWSTYTSEQLRAELNHLRGFGYLGADTPGATLYAHRCRVKAALRKKQREARREAEMQGL